MVKVGSVLTLILIHKIYIFYQHTERTFHSINGDVRKSDTGYLFLEWDRNSLKTIEGLTMPEEPQTLAQMCDGESLCGLPIVMSRMFTLG